MAIGSIPAANPSRNTWPIGVALELVSTLSGTIGKQLVRFSTLAEETGRHKFGHLAFVTGLALNTLVGPIVDMAAYAFAPQSLIAPFGGLDIVWNVLLAPFTLGEKVTPRRCFAVLLIFVGTVVSAIFGDHVEYEYTVKTIKGMLLRWRVVGYLVLLALWVLFNILCLMRSRNVLVRGISLGVTAGSIAGNMFGVKMTAELIKTSIVEKSWSALTSWVPYVVLLFAVMMAVSNVIFLTKGMREYEALFMVTIYEGTMVVVNCLSAFVILGEMNDVAASRLFAWVNCIFAIVCGMILLISGEDVRAKHEDELENTEMLLNVAEQGASKSQTSSSLSRSSEDDEEGGGEERSESAASLPNAATQCRVGSQGLLDSDTDDDEKRKFC